MAGPYGYYGVVTSVDDRIIRGDFMVHILTEEAEKDRICADVKYFKKEDIKPGMVVIYNRSYYWNLYYLNTDMGEILCPYMDILYKHFIEHTELSNDEIFKINNYGYTKTAFNNLEKLTFDEQQLWFNKFYKLHVNSDAVKSTDEDGRMLDELRFLRIKKNNLTI